MIVPTCHGGQNLKVARPKHENATVESREATQDVEASTNDVFHREEAPNMTVQ